MAHEAPVDFPADCPHPMHCHSHASSTGSSDIPAYSQLHRRNCFRRGQRASSSCSKRTCHLRTVHCCYSFSKSFPLKGPTHFWSTLTVAREIGLSHLSKFRRGRRIVSEDSRCRI